MRFEIPARSRIIDRDSRRVRSFSLSSTPYATNWVRIRTAHLFFFAEIARMRSKKIVKTLEKTLDFGCFYWFWRQNRTTKVSDFLSSTPHVVKRPRVILVHTRDCSETFLRGCSSGQILRPSLDLVLQAWFYCSFK